MTTFWSRSPLWHLRFSGDSIKSIHLLARNCYCRGGWNLIRVWLINCLNLDSSYRVLHISLMDEVSRMPPSHLHQFVKFHLPLPKSVDVLLWQSGNCAHHPVRFVIFNQHAQLCIFFTMILIIPILLIVRTCKFAQAVTKCIENLMTCLFCLAGSQFYLFSIFHIFLHMLNRSFITFKSLPCHSGLCIHIICNPLLFHLVAQEVCYSTFHQQNVTPCGSLNWTTQPLWTATLILPDGSRCSQVD